jgi:flagellar hook-basal body complex protein FliE
MSFRIDAAARSIAQLGNLHGGLTPPAATPTAPSGAASFGETLKRAVEQVSATQEGANVAMNAFLRGEDVELHQVMAATEEAGIALEMLVEIRNKFTEAYRTIINMQS